MSTLLLYKISGIIESVGLDTMVGNLHAIDYAKMTLAFDLIEEFRSPIADTICCSLFNLGILAEDDFEERDFSSDSEDFPYNEDDEIPEPRRKKGILATEKGLQKIIKAFEDKMNSEIIYGGTNERLSFSKIMYEQVKHYKRVIAGDELGYNAFYYK